MRLSRDCLDCTSNISSLIGAYWVKLHPRYFDRSHGSFASLRGRRHVFAKGGYAGEKLNRMLAGKGGWTVKVIRRSDTIKGFKFLPRRWVVERTFAWLGRCRRLAKDWETSIESSTARTLIAHIRILMRRLARHCYIRQTFESDGVVAALPRRHRNVPR